MLAMSRLFLLFTLASQCLFVNTLAFANNEKPNKDKKSTATKDINKKGSNMVLLDTSLGPIKIKLNSEKAPKSVENFLKYVDEGFYNNTIFHRVIDNFMVQGGGFTQDMNQKPTHDPVVNEADNGLKNTRGTLAMARTMVVNSATAQFFINVKDNAFLDFRDKSINGYGYAVFAEVVEGMDVVDKIKAVKTTHKDGMDDVPATPVVILSAKRIEK